jgi:hypothetical protein
MVEIKRLNAITNIIARDNRLAEKYLQLSRTFRIPSKEADYYLAIASRILSDAKELIERADELIARSKK